MKKLFAIVIAVVLSLSMAIPTFAATTKSKTATVISVQKKTAKFKLNNGVTITGKLTSKSGVKLPSKNMKYLFEVVSGCESNGDETVCYEFMPKQKNYAKYSYGRFHQGKGSGKARVRNIRKIMPCSAKFRVKKPSGGTMTVKAKDVTDITKKCPNNGDWYKYTWTTKLGKNGTKKVTYKFTRIKNGNKKAKFLYTYNVNYKDLGF